MKVFVFICDLCGKGEVIKAETEGWTNIDLKNFSLSLDLCPNCSRKLFEFLKRAKEEGDLEWHTRK